MYVHCKEMFPQLHDGVLQEDAPWRRGGRQIRPVMS